MPPQPPPAPPPAPGGPGLPAAPGPADPGPAGDAPAGDAPADPVPRTVRHRVRAAVVMLLKLALLAAACVVFVRLVRRIDWGQVASSLGQLSWWQALVLLAVVAARQTVNALPLFLFTDTLGLRRAVGNDLAGTTVATSTPPPADIVVRMSMFRSWGVDVDRGVAGLVLNSLLFYVARLAAPVAGFLLLLAWSGYDGVFAATAVPSGLGALGIVVGLLVAMRSGRSAAAVGRWTGSLAQRVRRTWPGPEAMERRLVDFHATMAEPLHRYGAEAGGASFLFIAIDAVILVLALRFVGVDASAAPVLLVLACFFTAYLMTALPFTGLGVLDAAVIALISDRSGADPSEMVAALVVWRVCIQLVPLVLGALVLVWWRTHSGRAGRAAPGAAQEDDGAQAGAAGAAPTG